MPNVSRPGDAVKTSGGEPLPTTAAASDGRQTLEISRLLVEVLAIGHAGRHGAAEGTPHPGPGAGFASAAGGGTAGHDGPAASPPPLASHVIRAAIHVYEHGPRTIGQLAAGIGISQGWASRVVDDMERAGYFERQRDPSDRRVVRVSLVPAAVDRVEQVYRWRGDAVEAALTGMSPEERSTVERFLRRFVEAARSGG